MGEASFDDLIPLADVPATGDISIIWYGALPPGEVKKLLPQRRGNGGRSPAAAVVVAQLHLARPEGLRRQLGGPTGAICSSSTASCPMASASPPARRPGGAPGCNLDEEIGALLLQRLCRAQQTQVLAARQLRLNDLRAVQKIAALEFPAAQVAA